MKPELQEKLASWLQTTTERIENFATTEIPPFIAEYLHWKFLESSINIGLWTVFFVIWIALAIIYRKVGILLHEKTDGMVWVIGGVITGVFIIPLFGTFPKDDIMTCVQIYAAPKIFLLEKTITLIKN